MNIIYEIERYKAYDDGSAVHILRVGGNCFKSWDYEGFSSGIQPITREEYEKLKEDGELCEDEDEE